MTKITIEIDGSEERSFTVEPLSASEKQALAQNSPLEVLAQATATGAINGGPAPSTADIGLGVAPVASSIPGPGYIAHEGVQSGGAAPISAFHTAAFHTER